MKVITSIRLAFVMSLMSLLFISSIACKKDSILDSTAPIVGKWLMIEAAEDNNNKKAIFIVFKTSTKNNQFVNPILKPINTVN
jgi:hypothetical protein